jgi:hypothetical protein
MGIMFRMQHQCKVGLIGRINVSFGRRIPTFRKELLPSIFRIDLLSCEDWWHVESWIDRYLQAVIFLGRIVSLKMEAECSSETLVTTYHTTWRHTCIPWEYTALHLFVTTSYPKQSVFLHRVYQGTGFDSGQQSLYVSGYKCLIMGYI